MSNQPVRTSCTMPRTLSLESRVVASPEQVSCELDNELVILNLRNGEYYGLDEVGAQIWTLIQDSTTVLAVRDAILRQFDDVDTQECTDDVLELLQDMADSNLLMISDDET
jgi:hypothetical protein